MADLARQLRSPAAGAPDRGSAGDEQHERRPTSRRHARPRARPRAVRQFEIANTSSGPLTFMVARSGCRCLFYDYRGKLPPKGKETITVTVDAARAKAGALQEQIDVTAKNDPSVKGAFTVQATIK